MKRSISPDYVPANWHEELLQEATELRADKAELLAALLAAEESLAVLIGMYGDSGAGLVLKQVRAAIEKVSK